LKSHEEMEPPRTFWYWSSLAAISAVVKDNIWLDRGGAYKLYPNIYVMLHAESGAKKGPPVNLARSLVKKVNNTRVIYGRSSIQAMVKELGTAYTLPGGRVLAKSCGFYCASEFTSSLVADPAAITILTDLYDRIYNEGQWESTLKMEKLILKDPVLTMLVATNQAHFDAFMEQKDITGGFIARTFIINASEEQTVNSLVKPLEHPPDKEALAKYLIEMSTLQGPFEPLYNNDYTPSGKIFDDWYKETKEYIKREKVKDETGTLNRIGDSVLKVAMLLSLSERPELVITETAMIEAIEVCTKLIGGLRRVTSGKNAKGSNAYQKALIIEELMKRDNHMITRQQLLKKYYYHFDSLMLNDIIPLLESAGYLVSEMHGSQVVYKMPEKAYEELKPYYEGKMK